MKYPWLDEYLMKKSGVTKNTENILFFAQFTLSLQKFFFEIGVLHHKTNGKKT